MCSNHIFTQYEPVVRPACSGKCVGGCGLRPAIWVIAACDGLIALFQQDPDGGVNIIPQGDSFLSPSVEAFSNTLRDALKRGAFNRLVLVGSPQDIAWVQLSLPASLTKHIVAEIAHPLMVGHFQRLPNALPLINEIVRLLN